MTVEEILKKKNTGLFTTEIELIKAFDEADDADANIISIFTDITGESHKITLREFSSSEMLDLQKLPQEDMAEELTLKLKDFIVGHTFKNEKGTEASTEQVVEIIKMSSSLMVYILETWQASLPLVKRTRQG